MLAIIGDLDITKNIENDSYNVELNRNFEQWLDGNGKRHRVYTSAKVEGSFNVICGAANGITTDEFFELIEDNITNNVLTLTVYVKNTGTMEAIECYYSIENQLYKVVNDESINVFTLNLEEC